MSNQARLINKDSDEGDEPSETASMLPAMFTARNNSRYAFLLPAVGGQALLVAKKQLNDSGYFIIWRAFY